MSLSFAATISFIGEIVLRIREQQCTTRLLCSQAPSSVAVACYTLLLEGFKRRRVLVPHSFSALDT